MTNNGRLSSQLIKECGMSLSLSDLPGEYTLTPYVILRSLIVSFTSFHLDLKPWFYHAHDREVLAEAIYG